METECQTTPLADETQRPAPLGRHFGLVFLYSPWAPQLSGLSIPIGADGADVGWTSVIDRSQRNQIVNCSLSKVHAQFSWGQQGGTPVCWMTHKSNNIRYSFVNGTPTAGSTPVHPGDLIRLGDTLFAVESDISKFPLPSERGFRSCLPGTEGMVGLSPAVRTLRDQIARYGPKADLDRFTHILIQGKSGVGKTFAAEAIHKTSGRKGAFLAKNCAETNRTTVDAELFGYIRGAFTGAETNKPGWFEGARGGTLFLDEVHCLPLDVQQKLLTVIASECYFPVGPGAPETKSDVRLVCATDADLASLVLQGQFRDVLYNRISEKTLTIPALRDRRIDAVEFIRVFLSKAERGTPPQEWPASVHIGAAVMEQLLLYSWPGNVRELEQTVRRMWIERKRSQTDLELDDETRDRLANDQRGGVIATPRSAALPPSIRRTNKKLSLTPEEIRDALETNAGNVEKTARVLSISPDTLQRRIKEFLIDVSTYRPLR